VCVLCVCVVGGCESWLLIYLWNIRINIELFWFLVTKHESVV